MPPLAHFGLILGFLTTGYALARQSDVGADTVAVHATSDSLAAEADPQVSLAGGLKGPSTGRLVTVGTTLTVVNAGIFLIERDRWWGNPDRRFHFQTDTDYARNFDKLGHFYGTHLYSMLIAGSFRWAGVRPARAALLGSSIAVAMQTMVEINDGFYRTWGFDWLDQTANVLGATWFYVRDRHDWAQNFVIRWGYWPNKIRKPADSFYDEFVGSFSDNYNGQSYWVGARMHRVLPDHLKKYWPRQLLLSTGVFLDGWATRSMSRDLGIEDRPGEVSLFLSVDLDFKELGARNFLGDFLNVFRVPAPAIRLWPEPRLFLLFWGQGK